MFPIGLLIYVELIVLITNISEYIEYSNRIKYYKQELTRCEEKLKHAEKYKEKILNMEDFDLGILYNKNDIETIKVRTSTTIGHKEDIFSNIELPKKAIKIIQSDPLKMKEFMCQYHYGDRNTWKNGHYPTEGYIPYFIIRDYMRSFNQFRSISCLYYREKEPIDQAREDIKNSQWKLQKIKKEFFSRNYKKYLINLILLKQKYKIY